jgi:hypothetical protein
MDFHDGSCCYTEQNDSVCVTPDLKSKYEDTSVCHKQLQERRDEINHLVSELGDPESEITKELIK